jgi:hypothetical protein
MRYLKTKVYGEIEAFGGGYYVPERVEKGISWTGPNMDAQKEESGVCHCDLIDTSALTYGEAEIIDCPKKRGCIVHIQKCSVWLSVEVPYDRESGRDEYGDPIGRWCCRYYSSIMRQSGAD